MNLILQYNEVGGRVVKLFVLDAKLVDKDTMAYLVRDMHPSEACVYTDKPKFFSRD
jgi:hypothetical protein